MEQQLNAINERQLVISKQMAEQKAYEKLQKQLQKQDKLLINRSRLAYFDWREEEQANIAFAMRNGTFYKPTEFRQYMGADIGYKPHRISLQNYINKKKANPQQLYEIELRENWELAND
jgi:hypothetical protein